MKILVSIKQVPEVTDAEPLTDITLQSGGGTPNTAAPFF